MKNAKNTSKRLFIKTETLRALSGANLARVNGGLYNSDQYSDGCFSSDCVEPESCPKITPGYTQVC